MFRQLPLHDLRKKLSVIVYLMNVRNGSMLLNSVHKSDISNARDLMIGPVMDDSNMTRRNSPPRRLQRLRKWINPDIITFSDRELIEMILTPVVPRRKTKFISKSLLKTFGSFFGVIEASAVDLMAIEGMGEDGIVALKAVRIAGTYMLQLAVAGPPKIQVDQLLTDPMLPAIEGEGGDPLLAISLPVLEISVLNKVQNGGRVACPYRHLPA